MNQGEPSPAAHLEQVINTLKGTLSGNESHNEIQGIVVATLAGIGIPMEFADQVIDNLTKNESRSTASNQPTLAVELGSEFSVGSNVRLDFHLYLPNTKTRRKPAITASASESLCKNAWKEKPLVRQEHQQFHWTFSEEVSISDQGSYAIDLEIDLDTPVNSELGKFLRASMRISVPNPDAKNKRKLEIESDDGALINLQGINLNDFESIKLVGGQNSTQNLLQVFSDNSSQPDHSATIQKFIIPLKHNFERSGEYPFLSPVIKPPAETSKSLALEFENGHRTILYNQIEFQMGPRQSCQK